jgi:hypothetical protein
VTTHSGVIGYTASAAILRKDGLEIDRKKYNNLRRNANAGRQLTRQEELELLLGDLEREGLNPLVRDEYILDAQGL